MNYQIVPGKGLVSKGSDSQAPPGTGNAEGDATRWAQDLAARLQASTEPIVAAIAKAPSRRTGIVARRVAQWALQKFPDAHPSGRGIRGPLGPHPSLIVNPLARHPVASVRGRTALHEFMFDLVVFRRGRLRPLLAAEFEWSNAQIPSRRSRFRDHLLSLFLPRDELAAMEDARRARAYDFLKVFVCCPEIGVFGGYLNPSFGGRVTVKHLLDQDAELLGLLANAHPLASFPMVCVAVVGTARGEGIDFGVRALVPDGDNLAEP